MALAEADYDRATATFEAALALLPAVGDARYLAGMRANLAAAALGRGEHRAAAAHGRAALELAGQIDLRRGIAIDLDILASVAARTDPARAARLFGAAEALREVDGLAPWSPAERALYGPYLQPLRARLGDAAFAAAWAAGRVLSVEEMFADALAGAGGEEG